jgi:Family of unknown function (DUF5677)
MVGSSKGQQNLRMLKVDLVSARTISRKLQQLLWKDMVHFEGAGFEFAIAYVLFLRAERTFSSIRTLARLRFVDDAFALVRVMVEKVINAEYILLSGTDTALDYIQYHAFREWRDLEELKNVNVAIAPKHTAEFLDRLRTAHDQAKMRTLPDGSQKSRYGRGHDWIEIGLSKRAEIIDQALMKRFSRRAFKSTQILYHSTYKKGAAYLHGMRVSLARSLELGQTDKPTDAADTIEMSLGIRIKDKDPRIAVEALHAANLAAIATILFIGKVFGKKKYLDWVAGFNGPYIENRRRAKDG